MTTQKRSLVLLLTAAVCFVMLFSTVFICAESDHDCTGADCAVCECITICESTLKTVKTAILIVAAAVTACYVAVSQAEAFTVLEHIPNPISLKVKLSN